MTKNKAREAVDALHPDVRARVLANVLWLMYQGGPDTQWDAGTIERVAEELDAVGLVPKER